jgi:hypothetical protein
VAEVNRTVVTCQGSFVLSKASQAIRQALDGSKKAMESPPISRRALCGPGFVTQQSSTVG